MTPRNPSSPLWLVHRITIGISALGAFAFSLWSLWTAYTLGRAESWGIGGFALVVSVVLSIYLVWFTKRSAALDRPQSPAPPEDPFEHGQ